MRVTLDYGRDRVELQIPDERMVHLTTPAASATQAGPASLAAALETPLRYVPLRQALTPDDHVAVVLDPSLDNAAGMLATLFDYLAQCGIGPTAITVILPPGGTTGWQEYLPEAYRAVNVEIHDPSSRDHLAYLASTKAGRRLYLNRTLVDADLTVLLTGRRYDALSGHGGGLTDLFPVLSDEPTRQELLGQLRFAGPPTKPSTAQRDAVEAAGQLNLYLLQVIDAAETGVSRVIAGAADSDAEGAAALDARWRGHCPQPAQTVVAALGGDPARHDFAALARAAACAARVVETEGRIILLSGAVIEPNEAVEFLRGCESPEVALKRLRKHRAAGAESAFLWASAAAKATLFLHSASPDDLVEELFASPLPQAANAQRLIDVAESCLVIDDAHQRMIDLEN